MAKLSSAMRLLTWVLAAFFVFAPPTESRADVWKWLEGLVRSEADADVAALSGEDLPPDAIVTKPDEKRVLRLGRDVLELYPSTAITIEESGPITEVRVIAGTVRAKVAKRKNGQTFEVRTLMLVATVKGTDFEVSTTAKASAVSVFEGRVAVKAVARVGGVDVTPGKTATVTAANGEPDLGATPPGGAAAAAKAVSGYASKSISVPGDDDGDDRNRSKNSSRDASTAGRGTSGGHTGNGSGGGSDTDSEGGESGEGGDDGGDGDDGDDGDDDD